MHCITGGATGADAEWAYQTIRFGGEATILSFKDHNCSSVKGAHIMELSPEVLEQADECLTEACTCIQRGDFINYSPGTKNLIRRNYWQAVKGGAVYAVGLISLGGYISGGTAWACEVAKMHNLPLHFFDQVVGCWLRWTGKNFEREAIPVLTETFAGIGVRRISQDGKKAILDIISLYEE